MQKSKTYYLEMKANKIRKSIIQMLVPYESHHIGCSLSIVDILAVLYFKILKVNPKKNDDLKRDIFILSKGHAACAVYATLAERGFFPKSYLKKYDINGGILPEHITKVVAGVEISTGSLGHGLPIAIGCSLSFKNDQKKNKVFVLMSDGELNEGSNWEGIMFAGFHKLPNLIAIIDCNKFQGYGTTQEVLNLSPLRDKIKPFGWNVYQVDGHNFGQLVMLFKKIEKSNNLKPHLVIAHTKKGKGIPLFENKFESHYQSIDQKTKEAILTNFKD